MSNQTRSHLQVLFHQVAQLTSFKQAEIHNVTGTLLDRPFDMFLERELVDVYLKCINGEIASKIFNQTQKLML